MTAINTIQTIQLQRVELGGQAKVENTKLAGAARDDKANEIELRHAAQQEVLEEQRAAERNSIFGTIGMVALGAALGGLALMTGPAGVGATLTVLGEVSLGAGAGVGAAGSATTIIDAQHKEDIAELSGEIGRSELAADALDGVIEEAESTEEASDRDLGRLQQMTNKINELRRARVLT